MAWLEDLVERMAGRFDWPYHSDGPAAAEPTAFAVLALCGHGRHEAAVRAAEALVSMQHTKDGSVGVTKSQDWPRWPTGLAICAWHAVGQVASADFREPIDRAVEFLLKFQGQTSKRVGDTVGHDTELIGWPWVDGTHSWLEPTAFSVLGLKQLGMEQHSRVRNGIRLLIDRQLPGGGCNYGNTLVFGQKLVEHIQPTGLALLALADERANPRVEATVALLKNSWPQAVGTASVCFAAMGLAAVGQLPPGLSERLEQLHRRQAQLGDSPYRQTLIALASLGEACPLIVGRESELQAPDRSAA
jgi:hypothetical protein